MSAVQDAKREAGVHLRVSEVRLASASEAVKVQRMKKELSETWLR